MKRTQVRTRLGLLHSERFGFEGVCAFSCKLRASDMYTYRHRIGIDMQVFV